MDDSREWKNMIVSALQSEPESFVDFDITKNVQDQLQEMVSDGVLFYLCLDFHDFCFGPIAQYEERLEKYKSMEQLWLAFVMKVKYGKHWDGKEWVK